MPRMSTLEGPRAPVGDSEAREFLRNADPVLAQLIETRPDFRPPAWIDALPPPASAAGRTSPPRSLRYVDLPGRRPAALGAGHADDPVPARAALRRPAADGGRGARSGSLRGSHQWSLAS